MNTNKSIFTVLFLVLVQFNYAQKGSYASLAIDGINGDAYGWAINYETQAEANKRAISECQKKGGNCSTVLKFEGGCGVYVVDPNNPGLYGWGVADTKQEAESIAKEEAKSRGGKNLVIRVWGCNDDSELKEHENLSPKITGVYGFHMSKSTEYKKCFYTKVVYYPGIALKSGDTWKWSSKAEQVKTPEAKHFWDVIEDNLYGYLGDMKEKVITRNKLDWHGINEIDNNLSHLIDKYDSSTRKTILENALETFREEWEADGFEVIEVNR